MQYQKEFFKANHNHLTEQTRFYFTFTLISQLIRPLPLASFCIRTWWLVVQYNLRTRHWTLFLQTFDNQMYSGGRDWKVIIIFRWWVCVPPAPKACTDGQFVCRCVCVKIVHISPCLCVCLSTVSLLPVDCIYIKDASFSKLKYISDLLGDKEGKIEETLYIFVFVHLFVWFIYTSINPNIIAHSGVIWKSSKRSGVGIYIRKKSNTFFFS